MQHVGTPTPRSGPTKERATYEVKTQPCLVPEGADDPAVKQLNPGHHFVNLITNASTESLFFI